MPQRRTSARATEAPAAPDAVAPSDNGTAEHADAAPAPAPRRRGRPKGSKTKNRRVTTPRASAAEPQGAAALDEPQHGKPQ